MSRDSSATSDRRSPFIRAHVSSVPREEPVVAFQVLHSVLSFAIECLVQLLDDLGACRLRSFIVRVHIVDEYCQALSSVADFRRTAPAWPRAIEHNPGFAEMHLRAFDRPVGLAITVMLGETECFRQPDHRIGDALISDMRQYDIRRYGAIFYHGSTI